MGSRMEKVRRPLRQPPNRKVRPKMKWVNVEKTVRLKRKAREKKNPPAKKS